MNNLDREIAELKQFIAELKEDRGAQKEKERRESWTKYTSLSIVFLAVLAAVASQWSGKYSGKTLVDLNNATYYQANASDQWGYYQAKSIKQNLYEVARDQIGATTANHSPAAGSDAVPLERNKILDDINAKIAKYEKEKAEIKETAEKLQRDRDKSRTDADQASAHGARMGSVVALYQISIALGSVCLLTKKKSLWYLSIFVGMLSTLLMFHVLAG
jgi:hypothetical protein